MSCSSRLIVCAALMLVAASASALPAQTTQPAAAKVKATARKTYTTAPAMTIDPAKRYTATIDTTAGAITVEFWPKDAPKHVNSFIFLAREGFYDGVIFHRVIPGFMIQGGDPTGTGMGDPGYKLPAEFNKNKHLRGVLSAARSLDRNSAGSQFFIMHDTAAHLDGQYTAFGKVLDGIEVVDKIVAAPTGAQDRPLSPVSIKTITVTEE